MPSKSGKREFGAGEDVQKGDRDERTKPPAHEEGVSANKSAATNFSRADPLFLGCDIIDQLYARHLKLEEQEEEIKIKGGELERSIRALEEEKDSLEERKREFQKEVEIVKKYTSDSGSEVRLNVGGTQLTTTGATLTSASLFFQALFGGAWDTTKQPIFLDRDPAQFNLLLNYMRSGCKANYLLEYCSSHGLFDAIKLLHEAEFFQVESAVSFLAFYVNHHEECQVAFDAIKVNVGGRLFETTRKTLRLCPFFASLLNNYGNYALPLTPSRLSSANPIFLDRNPDFFSILLDYLRSGCSKDVLKHHIAQLPPEMESYFLEDMKHFYEVL
jgi:hypothetical protein